MTSNTPHAFYAETAARHTAWLKKEQQKRNLVTALRIAAFAVLVWDIYGIIALDSRFWIGATVGTLLAFIVLGVIDNRLVRRIRYHKTMIDGCRTESEALDNRFDTLPTGEEFADSTHAYAADLDLFGEDSLFRRLNRTVTPDGKRSLAAWLLHPCRDADEIRARQEAAAELAAMPEWCLRFRTVGTLGRKKQGESPDNEAWNRFLAEPEIFGSPVWRWLPGLLPVLTIGAWSLTAFGMERLTWPAVLLSLAQLGIVGAYAKRVSQMQHRLDAFLGMMGSYTGLVRQLAETEFTSPMLRLHRDRITSDNGGALPAFRRLERILAGLEQRANLLAELVTNALWMRDVHLVRRLEKWRRTYGTKVGEWLEAVSVADRLVSLATFRFNHPEYTVPEITDDRLLEVHAVGHPMLPREGMVTNDLTVRDLHEFFVVTGANMAGKSTFLRTIGVSLVMALSGCVVCASRFRCRPMALFTSMRTTDNLSKGTSYFHAELLRLQQLVHTAECEERLFIILDEMLKGTNSQDKLNGSLRFLEKLRGLRVAGLVATHDLALGELQERFPANFHNVCFEIDHQGREIVYDYKLRPGVSRNMNASILLEQMGLIG